MSLWQRLFICLQQPLKDFSPVNLRTLLYEPVVPASRLEQEVSQINWVMLSTFSLFWRLKYVDFFLRPLA